MGGMKAKAMAGGSGSGSSDGGDGSCEKRALELFDEAEKHYVLHNQNEDEDDAPL